MPNCANQAVTLVVQNTCSLTLTASTMMAYNVVVSVGVTNEDKPKFVEVVFTRSHHTMRSRIKDKTC